MKQKDLEKIQALFQRAYEEPQVLRPLTKYDDKKDMVAHQYMVYSYEALPLLIEKMKALDPWDIPNNQLQMRFVVDEHRTCWFALEGRPGEYIVYDRAQYTPQAIKEQAPSHADMTPSHTCISSGIVVFSPEYQITRITNFSGHYRPKAGSLVWIIDALVKSGADFTPEVTLAFYWKTGGTLKSKQVSLTNDKLHTLLPSASSAMLTGTHQVAVYSKGDWRYFGAHETPQFKKQEESPRKRVRSILDNPLYALVSDESSEVAVHIATPAPTKLRLNVSTVAPISIHTTLTSSSSSMARESRGEVKTPSQDANEVLFESPPTSPVSRTDALTGARAMVSMFQPSSFDSPPPPSSHASQNRDDEPFSDGENVPKWS